MKDWTQPTPGSAAPRVGVVVAHPDDEILWCGGLLLGHPGWSTFVAGLCRGSDLDRAPRFFRVLETLGAQGALADLDDGPDQAPLPDGIAEAAVLALVPPDPYDLILTHAPTGEYTRHRRHEELYWAVWRLWQRGALRTEALWVFAYEDDDRRRLPMARADAPFRLALADPVWAAKRSFITDLYNYGDTSWEALATPRVEAFYGFPDPESAAQQFGECP
jgi:LmbE family N-acetylglucosaminyl deacetylase